MAVNDATIAENHGEVFTKPGVIDLMLAACRFEQIKPDELTRILEPSCGQGEFLCAMLRRFLRMADFLRKIQTKPASFKRLFVAFEIQEKNAVRARERVHEILNEAGISSKEAHQLAKGWVIVADFLTSQLDECFDLAIGNPPYVRIEEIAKAKLSLYRLSFSTMTDRADLYIPFYEKSLSLLKPGAALCFICTDRWTKNRYGRKLRELIFKGFFLETYVDFYGSSAFLSEVITYPSVTVIRKLVGTKPTKFFDSESATTISAMKRAEMEAIFAGPSNLGHEINDLVKDGNPWIFGCQNVNWLIAKLEKEFPTLEEAYCRVNIGAATGNNRVFIVDAALKIEKSRRLKCLTAREVSDSTIKWAGKYLVNPYDAHGLVSLSDYPLLKSYLESHKDELLERHVAKKNPNQWFKTIDRIFEKRARIPKLLIPDIKDKLTIAYDSGEYYPNNSLYFVTSEQWPLIELEVVLKVIGPIFLKAYSTKIAGGHLRFQAQHLRRIRIPKWATISAKNRKNLASLAKDFDFENARKLVGSLYALSKTEIELLK